MSSAILAFAFSVRVNISAATWMFKFLDLKKE
jgi:hypothetical protein